MSDERAVPPDFLASGRLESAIRHLGVDLIGKSIGVYQITSLLGVGGMGEVYRARDPKLGRDVAIKVLPVGFASDGERLARFQREARLLASLNHPHIGGIHGFEDASGVPALVLELVEGDTLAERLEKGPIPVSEALHIAKQIAEALETAHEHGVVHRDLKPANIKITPEGTVKVLDFGLAKAVQRAESALQTSGLSHEGIVVGTPAYMSPEQARGKPVDRRADIWAFGCVLYEMLTGRVAFAAATVTDTLAAVLDREPDWSAASGQDAAGDTEAAAAMSQKDPKLRLHDMGDAGLDLQDALTSPSAHEARSRHMLDRIGSFSLVLQPAWQLVRAWPPHSCGARLPNRSRPHRHKSGSRLTRRRCPAPIPWRSLPTAEASRSRRSCARTDRRCCLYAASGRSTRSLCPAPKMCQPRSISSRSGHLTASPSASTHLRRES